MIVIVLRCRDYEKVKFQKKIINYLMIKIKKMNLKQQIKKLIEIQVKIIMITQKIIRMKKIIIVLKKKM